MPATANKTPFDRDRFLRDIHFTAEVLGAGFSEAMTRKMLDVFAEEWRDGFLQFKTTDIASDGLYYRFLPFKGARDISARCKAAGLLPDSADPLVTLSDETIAVLGRDKTSVGLDFDAEHGLAKVWTFTGPVPVEVVLGVKSLPDSVRAHTNFFKRHGMNIVPFFASDVLKRSMNIYFAWEPQHFSRAWLDSLLQETGSPPSSDQTARDILESLPKFGGLNLTFSWDKPDLLRWSVYSFDVPFDRGAQSPVRLPTLPARLRRFIEHAPTLRNDPCFIVSWSYGKAGTYMKLEKGYSGDLLDLFSNEWGMDIARP